MIIVLLVLLYPYWLIMNKYKDFTISYIIECGHGWVLTYWNTYYFKLHFCFLDAVQLGHIWFVKIWCIYKFYILRISFHDNTKASQNSYQRRHWVGQCLESLL